jgi:hypothetical protein
MRICNSETHRDGTEDHDYRCFLTAASERDDLAERCRALAAQWEIDQLGYPDSERGKSAAAAVRCCMKELRALLAAPASEDENGDDVRRQRVAKAVRKFFKDAR